MTVDVIGDAFQLIDRQRFNFERCGATVRGGGPAAPEPGLTATADGLGQMPSGGGAQCLAQLGVERVAVEVIRTVRRSVPAPRGVFDELLEMLVKALLRLRPDMVSQNGGQLAQQRTVEVLTVARRCVSGLA